MSTDGLQPSRLSRRDFLAGASAIGATAWGWPHLAQAEPPPETTRIRFQDAPAACLAPQYIAEELLKAEGFTDVQYVKTPDFSSATLNRAVAAGEIHFAMNDAPIWLMHVDGETSLVVLAGCYELFGTNRVRSIRDLKGKTVAVPDLRSGRHMFVAAMAASVGLDPSRDIRWAVHPPGESMRLFTEGKIDAIMGFPPEPQELRAKKIGHVLVNTLTDRPWSQYFCCMVGASREFVRKSPVATKTRASGDSEGRRHVRQRAGPGRPLHGRPGLRPELRRHSPDGQGDRLPTVAAVRP